jgi:hypothetical protein
VVHYAHIAKHFSHTRRCDGADGVEVP